MYGVKTAGIMAVRRALYTASGPQTTAELVLEIGFSENAIRNWCRMDPYVENQGTEQNARWGLTDDAPNPFTPGFEPDERDT